MYTYGHFMLMCGRGHHNIVIILLLRRRQWHPAPVLLPGKSPGRRSLVGCSPWGLEESDMTDQLHFHFSPLCIGKGNGNPLQCSCLENPRDGVTQSRMQLKWLSSSILLLKLVYIYICMCVRRLLETIFWEVLMLLIMESAPAHIFVFSNSSGHCG